MQYPPIPLELVNELVTISQSKLDLIRDSRDRIQECILSKIEPDSIQFRGQGSFYKSTTVSVNNNIDVDILTIFYNHPVVQINCRYNSEINSSIEWKRSSQIDPWPTSESYLNYLLQIMFEVQRSLRIRESPFISWPTVTIRSNGFNFEFTPALCTEYNNVYLIPYNKLNPLDNSHSNGWRLTFPRLNKERIENLRALYPIAGTVVKLLKYINLKRSWGLLSYAIEIVCCKAAEQLNNNRPFDSFNLTYLFYNFIFALLDHIHQGCIYHPDSSTRINLIQDMPTEQIKWKIIRLLEDLIECRNYSQLKCVLKLEQ